MARVIIFVLGWGGGGCWSLLLVCVLMAHSFCFIWVSMINSFSSFMAMSLYAPGGISGGRMAIGRLNLSCLIWMVVSVRISDFLHILPVPPIARAIKISTLRFTFTSKRAASQTS